MRLIDTHTHLYLPEFSGDEGKDAVTRAIDAGVDKMIFPNVDLTTVEPMTNLAERYPDHVAMAMGLHPTEVKDYWREVMDQIDTYIDDGQRYVAIGEIGIDLYWDKTFVDEQMQVFENQVNRAIELGLPVIIHCREGLPQALEVLQGLPGAKGVFHSFGGTEADVDAVRRVGDFYFGINGVVTFKNSRLRETLPAIGLERILLETDSPYLAPVPHRGKRNESAFLGDIASHISDNMGIPIEEVAAVTSANAETLFAL